MGVGILVQVGVSCSEEVFELILKGKVEISPASGILEGGSEQIFLEEEKLWKGGSVRD